MLYSPTSFVEMCSRSWTRSAAKDLRFSGTSSAGYGTYLALACSKINRHLEVNPPPTIYSGKDPAIHSGVVQASILIHGLTTSSTPLIFVAFVKLFPSHRFTSISTISLSFGFSRLPNSEDTIVKGDIVCHISPQLKLSHESANDFTSDCH